MTNERIDVTIIGGGPAGLTAALYLGRARMRVRVVDRGAPRHAVSAGVHNFLSRDGLPPASLRLHAWEQMAAYPTVEHRQADVHALTHAADGWAIETADDTWHSPAVLLAPGVIDEHPDVPGLRERWGAAVHQCPYCHGWELRDRPLALWGSAEHAGHLGPLLKSWSDEIHALTHGADWPADVVAKLTQADIPIHHGRIVALEGEGRSLQAVRFADGSTLEVQGLFIGSPQRQVRLVQALGLDLDESGYVVIDEQMRTSRAGLWAAGDCTTRAQQVVLAAAQGAQAAIGIHQTLALG